jgi:integrase
MTTRNRYLYPKTVKGNRYLFFRFKGKLTPLPLDQNSADFRRAYDACMKDALPVAEARRVRKPKIGAEVAFLPETFGAAIDKYLDSAHFAKRPASTQLQYRYTLQQLRERIGVGRFADLDTDAVDMYTEAVAKQCGESVADRHMRMISLVWQTVRKYPQFRLKDKFNPTLNAEKRYTVQQKHRPWSREAQERFMELAPDHLKLAKLLLHFSGQRGGDTVKMKWTDYDGKGIWVRPEKTMGQVEAVANYHLCPKPLRDALATAPRVAETILVNAHGTPYATSQVLSKAIHRELVRHGLAKKGERSFVMHGLRKNAAADVGSLGVGPAGIKTVTGHRTDDEANYYAAGADMRRVNAMVVEAWDAKIEREK